MKPSIRYEQRPEKTFVQINTFDDNRPYLLL